MPDNDSDPSSTRNTSAENAAVVRNLTEYFNAKDREQFDTCYADPVVVHSPSGTRTMTHDEHWEEVLGMFEAVPDLTAVLGNVAADGDHVFYRATYTGIHENRIHGVDPTGERLEWDHWSDYRFEDGVIAEAWQLSDTYGLYKQLGLVDDPDA